MTKWQKVSIIVSLVFVVAGTGILGVSLWQGQLAEVDPSAIETVTASQPTASTPKDESPTKIEIEPAPPVKFSIPELGFEAPVVSETLEEMAVGYNTTHSPRVKQAIYASDYYSAAWPSNYGSMPGMSSSNTTYLTCHSSAIRDLPCNALAVDGTVKLGQSLVVTTDNGAVVYQITKRYLLEKTDFASSEEARLIRPGGIVFTVCMLSEGKRTEYAWLFIGQAVEERSK